MKGKGRDGWKEWREIEFSTRRRFQSGPLAFADVVASLYRRLLCLYVFADESVPPLFRWLTLHHVSESGSLASLQGGPTGFYSVN